MDIYKNHTLANKPTCSGVEDGDWGAYSCRLFLFSRY